MKPSQRNPRNRKVQKITEKFTFTSLEKIVATIHSSLPHLPKSATKFITEVLPYISLLASALYLGSAIFPTILTPLFVDINNQFVFNNYLMRVVLVLVAIIFFMAFKPLNYKAQKGWDSLWYISIFHAFFSIFVFKPVLLLVPLIMWYFLFEIRKEYN